MPLFQRLLKWLEEQTKPCPREAKGYKCKGKDCEPECDATIK